MLQIQSNNFYIFFQRVNVVPMLPSKFLHLKFLSIATGGLTFDYLSLISFLDASPSLETFILAVSHRSSYPTKIFFR